MGETNVGKRSIIDRYANYKFNEYILPEKKSIYFSKKVKYLEEKKVAIKFKLWTLFYEGKENRSCSLCLEFCKNSNAILLVYDRTNKKSLEKLKNYWYNEAKKFFQKDASK